MAPQPALLSLPPLHPLIRSSRSQGGASTLLQLMCQLNCSDPQQHCVEEDYGAKFRPDQGAEVD